MSGSLVQWLAGVLGSNPSAAENYEWWQLLKSTHLGDGDRESEVQGLTPQS